jgi:hypothetical protein
MYRANTFATALALSASAAVADDTLRCGNAIIDVGMVAEQVIDRCGEPKSKAVEDVPVRQRTKSGGVNTIGTTRVERWTYDRGYGQFPALLTFEAGKLKSIELLTRR